MSDYEWTPLPVLNPKWNTRPEKLVAKFPLQRLVLSSDNDIYRYGINCKGKLYWEYMGNTFPDNVKVIKQKPHIP